MSWHTPDKEGHTRAEKVGHVVPVPDEPELLPGSSHILEWFYQLHTRRQAGMAGHLPLLFGDIKAWQELTGTMTRPEEIEAILAMDTAYLNAVAEKRKREEAND